MTKSGIRFKVVSTFIILAVIVAALVLMNVASMARIQRDVSNLRSRVLPKLQTSEQIARNIGLMQGAVLHYAITNDPEEWRQIELQITELQDKTTALYERLERLLDNAAEKRLYDEALEARRANRIVREELLEASRREKGTPLFVDTVHRHFATHALYQHAVTAFGEQIQRDADTRWTESLQTMQRLGDAGHWLVGIGLLIGAVMTFVIARVARELAQRNRQFEIEITERRRAEEALVEAIEATQRQIARDLHDSLVQHLSGIHLLNEALRARLAAHLPEEEPRAARISELLQEGIAQTRGFTRGLSPVEVETRGLFEALQELTGRLRETWGIECVVRGAGFPAVEEEAIPRGLGLEVATNIYRIAQEALHNALRHGSPSRIEVELSREDGALVLKVSDNGKGLARVPPAGEGLGLRSMHYRARVIGARLEIQGAPGEGTTVVCCLPNN